MGNGSFFSDFRALSLFRATSLLAGSQERKLLVPGSWQKITVVYDDLCPLLAERILWALACWRRLDTAQVTEKK